MDAEFSTVISTKEEAVELFEKYFRTLDEGVFAPVIRGMTTPDDEGVFAIMRGSGNDMRPFTMACYLVNTRNILSVDESMIFVDLEAAARKARAA